MSTKRGAREKSGKRNLKRPCPRITKKGLACPNNRDLGHDECHVHRDRSLAPTRPEEVKGRRVRGGENGPAVTACFWCTGYVECWPVKLDDGTWAWLCAGHRLVTCRDAGMALRPA